MVNSWEFSENINSLFNSVSYRIGSILVDPGDYWYGFDNVEAILLTHAHFDHIYGLNEVMERNQDVRIYTNRYGLEMLKDARKNLSFYHQTPFVLNYPDCVVVVEEIGNHMQIGSSSVKAIYTPGHNPSCITWEIGDYLITGDAYIPGIKTVTNLPRGNKKLAEKSTKLILGMADNKMILPGHHIEQ